MHDLPKQLDRRLTAVIVVVALLVASNDVLPYLGLRDDSCQTMFSGLTWDERSNDHFFVPQHALSDQWAYLAVTDVAITPPPATARLQAIARWLTRDGRDRNTEAVRVAVAQLCDAGHRVSLTARRTDGVQRAEHHADACRVPALAAHRFLPVRLYDTDVPAR